MKPTIIGIAGGTASGKTTIAKQLYEEAKNIGSVILIRIDDYYFGKIKVPMADNGIPNFDHPDAYDVDLIVQNLEDLINNKAIEKPTYDFVESKRTDVYEHIEPAQVIIVEGIMTFAIEKLRKYFDIKIFVDTPSDIRLIRRLKRDMIDRKRSLESALPIWDKEETTFVTAAEYSVLSSEGVLSSAFVAFRKDWIIGSLE